METGIPTLQQTSIILAQHGITLEIRKKQLHITSRRWKLIKKSMETGIPTLQQTSIILAQHGITLEIRKKQLHITSRRWKLIKKSMETDIRTLQQASIIWVRHGITLEIFNVLKNTSSMLTICFENSMGMNIHAQETQKNGLMLPCLLYTSVSYTHLRAHE